MNKETANFHTCANTLEFIKAKYSDDLQLVLFITAIFNHVDSSDTDILRQPELKRIYAVCKQGETG